MPIKNIVFDFGGVLIDWNPRYLYRKHFASETEMEDFLTHICSNAWNAAQDRGRPLTEATQLLQRQFPQHHQLIQLFYDEWEQMLGGVITGSEQLLYRLKIKYPVYGLTNWSAETFPVAQQKYPVLKAFDGIVVSGEEKLIKPDPALFQILLNRYRLIATETLFIDDNTENIATANRLGFITIHFQSPEQLEQSLKQLGCF